MLLTALGQAYLSNDCHYVKIESGKIWLAPYPEPNPGGGRNMEEQDNKQHRELPLLPLRGILVFPFMVIHLDVGRDKSVKAIEEAMIGERAVFLATQKEAQTDNPEEEDIYQLGTVAEVKQMLKLPGGTIRVLVEGLSRARIKTWVSKDPYFKVEVEEYSETPVKNPEVEALMRNLIHQFEQFVKMSKKIPPETVVTIANLEEPGRLADIIASHLGL